MAQERKFLAIFWLFDSMIWARKTFKNIIPRSYMVTFARHVYVKFSVDPTYLIVHRVRWVGDLWNFLAKKVCVTSSDDITTFWTFQERKSFDILPSAIEPSLVNIQKAVSDLQSPKYSSLFYYSRLLIISSKKLYFRFLNVTFFAQ